MKTYSKIHKISKLFENIQMFPMASVCVRMHPNWSEWMRMGPNTSETLEKLAKTSKNLAKTSKNFAKISVKNFFKIFLKKTFFFTFFWKVFYKSFLNVFEKKNSFWFQPLYLSFLITNCSLEECKEVCNGPQLWQGVKYRCQNLTSDIRVGR